MLLADEVHSQEDAPPEALERVLVIDEDCRSRGHPANNIIAAPDHKRTDCVRNLLNRLIGCRVLPTLLFIVTACLVAYIIFLKSNQCSEQQILNEVVQSSAAESGKDEVLPPCGDDWIWYRNKCFYFSEAEGNWTEAKDLCAALNSSLAIIDTQKELVFMLRYKGDHDHWIGLRRRDPDQLWIWVNGTEFNNWFTVEDYADCAYLNHGRVKSVECYSKRRWSCSKMSTYERKRK